MTNTKIMKMVWQDVYNPELDIAAVIEKYFHPEYMQCINGISMNRADYTLHIIKQRKSMTINSIEYKHLLETGNELFALYFPRGVNSRDQPIEAEVIAYYQFMDQKIYRIHGQVRMVAGEFSDADMKNS